MPQTIRINVNGREHEVEASGETPLLYVLRNEMGQHGPRFGCGLAQCGACTVHIDGKAARSCVTPVEAVGARKVVTLDGLAGSQADRRKLPSATLHPVQQAFIDEQAMQCGYCSNGWIMTAAALLDHKPNASEREIREGLSGLKCRCGSHMSILRAVKLAAARMSGKVV